MFQIKNEYKLIFIGTIAGVISSLFGIGGGIIFVPAFNLIMKLDLRKSIGTSLSCIVPTAIVSAATHYTHATESFDWESAIILSIFAIISSQVGAYIVQRIKLKYLPILYAIFIMVTSFKLLFNTFSIEDNYYREIPPAYILAIIGSVTGVIGSLLGLGGGIVIVGILVSFFYVSMTTAVTLSLVVIVPSTLSGLVGHIYYKNVEWKYTLFTVPTALLSAYLTAYLSHNISPKVLQTLFSIFSLFMAYSLWKQNKDK